MTKHLKKLSEEVIDKNLWWEYKHDTYEKPRGGTGDYYYAETGGAVMVVPVLADSRVVMVIQHRYLSDRQSVEFPCGGMKPGIGALENARRELLEETGWVAEDFISIGSFEPDIGLIRDLVHVYIARADNQQNPQPDDTEEIEIIYRHPEEIEEMISRGDIWDGETLAAWCLVRGSLMKNRQ
ncbi:MAG: NUDIX hydrolase [Patescibacteria group bacterium]